MRIKRYLLPLGVLATAATDTAGDGQQKMDTDTYIFLLTAAGNLFIFLATILFYRKIRYWREDDKKQQHKQKQIANARKLSRAQVAAFHEKGNRELMNSTMRMSTMRGTFKSAVT